MASDTEHVEPPPVALTRLGQALNHAISRRLQERAVDSPITPHALTDALCGDAEVRAVLVELFETDVTLPTRTVWSAYLDTVDQCVYDPDVEPASGLECVKIARERFAFRLVRALGVDDLVRVCDIFQAIVPVIFHAPLFDEVPPEFPADVIAAMVEGRNQRTMRLWHFLSAPCEQRRPAVH